MTDIPVIFSAPMVRALLAGRKTMTRRLAWRFVGAAYPCDEDLIKRPSPWQRVRPGDRLWVRENFGRPANMAFYYAADPDFHGLRLRPSIHMPRVGSRITLTVTATKIERLQDISEADAKAEGVSPEFEIDVATFVRGKFDAAKQSTHKLGFKHIWNELHGPKAWDENPQVVCISFSVALRNIDRTAA